MNFIGALNTLFNNVEKNELRDAKNVTDELKKNIKTEEDIVQFAQFKYLLSLGKVNFVYEMFIGHTVENNLFDKMDGIVTCFDQNSISPQIYSYYLYCTLQALKVKTDKVNWFNPFENQLDGSVGEMNRTFGIGLFSESTEDYEITNYVIKKFNKQKTYVTIPNGILGVEDRVFFNNQTIEFVTIPSTLNNLPAGMLGSCQNLQTLLIPSTVKTIPAQFCKGNRNLSLVIANGIKEIKPKAFEGTAINTISFLGNKQLEVIGAEAFKDCEELKKIDAKNVSQIHPCAFNGCINVQHVSLTITSSVLTNDYKMYSFFENGIADFRRYVNLTSLQVIVVNGEIPDSFFAECSSVEKIEIIGEVNKIGANAFKNCSSLKEIVIDFKGSAIEEGTFFGCKQLTTIPKFNSVEVIENEAFKGCSSIEVLSFATIAHLGKHVFEDCSSLTDIKINLTGDLLPEYTFSGCYSLRKYDFLKKVKRIGAYALAKMTFADKFEIPSSIKGIQTNAFDSCVFEGVLTIPKGCKINTAAFSNINRIHSIIYNNLQITDLNNVAILPHMIFEEKIDVFNANFKQLQNLKIDVAKIDEGAFKGWQNIDKVVIEGEFVEIPSSCFENCVNLTGVKINSSKFQIKTNAFTGCSRFNKLKTNQTKIEFKNENVVDLSLATKVEPNAFNKCISIEEVCVTITEQNVAEHFKLHSMFEEIKSDIVGKYEKLKNVILNLETGVVPEYFFDACENIASIKIVGELEELSEGFFRNCTKLANLEMQYVGSIIPKECFKNCISLRTLTDFAYVDFIDKEAFSGCKSLKAIKVDCEIQHLGVSAFEDCISLEDVDMIYAGELLPERCFANCNSIKSFKFINNISKIQSYALSNITFPADFVVPARLDYIESYAFAGSKFVDVLVLPAAKVINNLAFANVTGFVRIEFNNLRIHDSQKVELLPFRIFCDTLRDYNFKYANVEAIVIRTNNIVDNAFKDWEFIKNVSITPAVKQLPNSCFEGCISLERIRLPYYDIALGNRVFTNCTNLVDVSFTEFDTKTKAANFIPLGTYHNCTKLESISISIDEAVLSSGLKLYSFFESNLEEFNMKYKKLNSIKIRSTIKEIPESFFEGCINLEKIIVLDEIKVLHNNVFAHCSNLQQLKMKFIGEVIPTACFQSCERLPIITNLKSVKIIEERAFERCFSITVLQFRTPIESLGARAFENCKNLEKINMYYLGEFLPSLCFAGCEALLDTPHLLKLVFADNSAFEGCINLDCVTINAIEGASFTNIFSTSKRISKINFTSEHIPARFFSNLRGVEEIVFTKRILSIGDSAFDGVRDLATIKNIDYAESIGDYAFAHSDIESIKLSPKTKFVGVGIFAGCEKLVSVEMPLRFMYAAALFDSLHQNSTKKVEQLNGNTTREFYIPESLEFMVINDGEIPVGAFSGMRIDVYINNDVTTIPNYAFYGCGEVVFAKPELIEYVGEYSFACSSLSNIILNGVKVVDKYAFSNSTMLSLEIGDKLTDFHNTTLIDSVVDKLHIVQTEDFLTFNEMLVDIKKGSIVHVNNVSGEIVIPDQVHTLNSNTFVNCENITKVNTNKVKNMSTHTFVNCDNLTSLVVEPFIENMEQAIFKNCPKIDSLSLNFLGETREKAKDITYLFQDMRPDYQFKHISIVEGAICTEPFRNCNTIDVLDIQKVDLVKMNTGLFKKLNIGELIIPDNTVSIKEYAFDNTFVEKLTNKNNKNVVVNQRCIYAENKLIYCCDSELPNVMIPKTVKEVLPGAFQICKVINHLQIDNDSVKLNNSLKTVEDINTLTIGKINGTLSEIFENAIKTIDVLNYKGESFTEGFLVGLENIKGLNMLNIKSLGVEVLKDSVEKLNILAVNIGANLAKLDPEMLRLCNVDNINVMNNQHFQTHNNMLIDNKSNAIIYAAKQIAEKIVIDFNVRMIANNAFKDCVRLVSMNTGKVQEIGSNVFNGCESLRDIEITNNCQIIGDDLIKQCFNLEKISIPFVGKSKDKTEKISHLIELEREVPIKLLTITNQKVIDGTFAYCKNIHKIVFEDGTTTINANSFNSSMDVKEISIPRSTTNVGEFLFFNCKKKVVAYVYSRKSSDQWNKDWKKVKDSNFFANIKVVYQVEEV